MRNPCSYLFKFEKNFEELRHNCSISLLQKMFSELSLTIQKTIHSVLQIVGSQVTVMPGPLPARRRP